MLFTPVDPIIEEKSMFKKLDFPKVECPFVRKLYRINKGFKEHRRKLNLRKPEVYLVTPEINPNYNWVFEDKDVRSIEKLDGCLEYHMSVLTEDGPINIGKLVNNKLDVKVLSYNLQTNETEFKPITKFHKYENSKPLLKIAISDTSNRLVNIVCTEDHKFYDGEKFVAAKHLVVGGDLQILNDLPMLTYPKKQIILGTILGDGSVYQSGVNNIKYSFNFCHGIAQSEYFAFKLKMLKGFARETKGARGGFEGSKETKRASGTFKPEVSELVKLFMVNGKKTVNESLTKEIGIVALAIWYGDDGNLNVSNKSPRAIFSCHRYNHEEVGLLCNRINQLGFKASVNNTKKGFIINVSKEGSEKLFSVIAPFIIPSMQYKLPKNFRCEKTFWDFYQGVDSPIRKTKILQISLCNRFNCKDINFVYDLSIEGNNNYFTRDTLVHNSNIKLFTNEDRLLFALNRANYLDLQSLKGKLFLNEGILEAIQRSYVESSGEQAGELMGPKLQGNPYNLDRHLWYPFKKAFDSLSYKSFHDHDRTFDNWSSWFENHLKSIFYTKIHKTSFAAAPFAEGVVFTSPSRKEKGLISMAKLRRDMFRWYYEPHIEIGEEIKTVEV